MFTKLPSEVIKGESENSIIVSHNLRTAEKFDNYDEFYNFAMNQPNPCFYEVLSESKKRKMYFDIDIHDKTKIDIDKFIYEVCSIIRDILQDSIIMTTKSQNDTTVKCGIHFIIVNYVVSNVYNAKRFYDTVFSKIPNEYKDHFDDKVYKSIQQFRVLFSSKMNENRPKRFFKMIPSLNIKVDKKLLLNLSLIQIIKNDIGIEVFEIPEDILFYVEPKNYENNYYHNESDIIEQIDDNKIKIILKLASQYMDFSCFKYTHTKGIFIVLKRLKPSKCFNCNRIHENENAFLFEANNKIFFGCRRNNKNYHLCNYIFEDNKVEIKNDDIIVKEKKIDREKLKNYFS